MLSNQVVRLFVSSLTPIENEKKLFLKKNGINFEEGTNTLEVLNTELLMISPSVKRDHPLLKKAIDLEVEVKIDIELFFDLLQDKPKTIAITGTNGKTTTVEMITHILKQTKKAFSVGNIGNPTFDYLSYDLNNVFLVFELSSYQIKHIKKRKTYFDLSGVTNISEDHLDWHGSFESYRKDKLGLSELSKCMILPSDIIGEISSPQEIMVYDNLETFKQFAIPGSITGEHNRRNAYLASKCCFHVGISEKQIYEALKTFEFGEHRMEKFLVKNGVTFINDSKSTNAHALLWALKSLTGSILLLAGAKDKGDDYSEVGALIAEKVKKTYLCGESAQRLSASIPSHEKEIFSDWQKTVKKAIEESESGDIVLFSPGGSSFDRFKNYKERGFFFKEFVKGNT
jgi:UDP-N-acetylmuramoylalanine--D-glutamate ligase